MNIAKVKLSIQEAALGLSNLPRALEFFRVTILNLKEHYLIVGFGSIGVEDNVNFQTATSGYHI
jgi:hypothetical protein